MKYVFSLLVPAIAFLSFLGAEIPPPPYSVNQLENLFPKTNKTFRITGLWPSNYLAYLPIEPAIPQNFVLKCWKESQFHNYFAWGPKEAFDTCDLANPDSFTHSFLLFSPSEDILQTGQNSFSKEDEMEKSFKELGAKKIFKKKYHWGNYPVLSIGGENQGKPLFAAWIGLNYCSNVLFALLEYPHKEGRPNKEDIQLWNTFLTQTKALPEPDSFIAQGYDMRSGYTWFDMKGSPILAIAERKKNSSLVQIVVIPLGKEIKFSFKKAENGPAGIRWRYGQEIVKIFANISKTLPEGGSLHSPSTVINVFPTTVDEFSFDKETLQKDPTIFCIQKKMQPSSLMSDYPGDDG